MDVAKYIMMMMMMKNEPLTGTYSVNVVNAGTGECQFATMISRLSGMLSAIGRRSHQSYHSQGPAEPMQASGVKSAVFHSRHVRSSPTEASVSPSGPPNDRSLM